MILQVLTCRILNPVIFIGEELNPEVWPCFSEKAVKSGSFVTPEPRKKPSYFPLYWLVNRDPYSGLL